MSNARMANRRTSAGIVQACTYGSTVENSVVGNSASLERPGCHSGLRMSP